MPGLRVTDNESSARINWNVFIHRVNARSICPGLVRRGGKGYLNKLLPCSPRQGSSSPFLSLSPSSSLPPPFFSVFLTSARWSRRDVSSFAGRVLFCTSHRCSRFFTCSIRRGPRREPPVLRFLHLTIAGAGPLKFLTGDRFLLTSRSPRFFAF